MSSRKRRSSEHRIRVQVETLDLTPPISNELTPNTEVPSTATEPAPTEESPSKQPDNHNEQNTEQQKRIYARKRTCCGPRVFSSYEPATVARDELLAKQVSESCPVVTREVEPVVAVVQDVSMNVPAESLTSNPTVTVNEEAASTSEIIKAHGDAQEKTFKTTENLIENSQVVNNKGINKRLG